MRRFKILLFLVASLTILILAGTILSDTVRFESHGLGHLWNANQPDIVLSPDQSWKVVLSKDRKSATFVDARTTEENTSLDLEKEKIYSIAFGSDNRTLAIGGKNNVRLWDAISGRDITRMTGQSREIIAVAVSPDGEKLASGSFTGSLWLRDAKTGKRLGLQEPKWLGASSVDYPEYVAFSPDGQSLAAIVDERVGLWAVQDGRLRATIDKEFHVPTFTTDDELVFLVESDDAIVIRVLSSRKLAAIVGGYIMACVCAILLRRHFSARSQQSPTNVVV